MTAAIVLMGVSGAGKSTIAALLAARLDRPWIDADDLHPAENIAKMRAGAALTDEDRWPWLDAVAARVATGEIIVACSALRRRYRDRLRQAAPDLTLVHLSAERDLLTLRMGERQRGKSRGHFMPTSLLDSQLATLEPPTDLEHPIDVDVSLPPRTCVDLILAALRERSESAAHE